MLYGADRRVYRAKLPLQVLRGFEPTEPVKLSCLAAPKDGEAIREGMVIKKDGNGEWVKALDADATAEGTQFFIALHDQDSHDVQAAGGLVGLDCSDAYEIQTGYYTAPGGGFTVGMALTVAGDGTDDGLLVQATSGDTIVGYVTKVGGGTGNAIEYTGKTPSTAAADSEVIQVKTAQTGVLRVAT